MRHGEPKRAAWWAASGDTPSAIPPAVRSTRAKRSPGRDGGGGAAVAANTRTGSMRARFASRKSESSPVATPSARSPIAPTRRPARARHHAPTSAQAAVDGTSAMIARDQRTCSGDSATTSAAIAAQPVPPARFPRRNAATTDSNAEPSTTGAPAPGSVVPVAAMAPATSQESAGG